MRFGWSWTLRFPSHPLRPDWESVKNDIMHDAIRAKFTQNSDLKRKLLQTGNAELIEASPKDAYWGTGPNGDGLNMLGKILMTVRQEIRQGSI